MIKKSLSLFLLVLFLFSCKEDKRPNVLIVTFDTTRADHIGVYGKENAMTPVIDALAKDGVLYEYAYSPIPLTLPSHSSLMTGQVPFVHGVRDNGSFKLAKENLTLAEILNQNGYKTAAAIGSFPLSSEFGLNQGFEFYDDELGIEMLSESSEDNDLQNNFFFPERKASFVNKAILSWLKENSSSPFFIWAHYFDPHHPHNPPAPYSYKFTHDLYQGEISYSDKNFGVIIEYLKQLGVYDNTIIVFTADHGEGMGEHDESTHSFFIYDSTQHIPLIIKYPNQKNNGLRIKERVGIIDVFPTILELLDFDFDTSVQGESLVVNNIKLKPREIYLESLAGKFNHGWGEQRGLISENYKYIHGPEKELYNLDLDPKEIKNLVNEFPELTYKMKTKLNDYIDEYKGRNFDSQYQLNDKIINNLRGLGYLQVNNSNKFEIIEKLDDSGVSPHQFIKEKDLITVIKVFISDKKYHEAKQISEELLLKNPNNLIAKELLIESEVALKNFKQAKILIEELPKNRFSRLSNSQRMLLLAEIAYNNGEISKSKEILLESEQVDKTIIGQNILAKIFLLENNHIKYQTHLKNILEINDSSIDIKNQLAQSYFKTNHIQKAKKLFSETILDNPFHPKTFYYYAEILKLNKEFEEAEKVLYRAIDLDNKNDHAYLILIEVLIKLNKIERANKMLIQFEENASTSPSYLKAKNLLGSL